MSDYNQLIGQMLRNALFSLDFLKFYELKEVRS